MERHLQAEVMAALWLYLDKQPGSGFVFDEAPRLTFAPADALSQVAMVVVSVLVASDEMVVVMILEGL